MSRALYHLIARTYYRWALNALPASHPDASYVALRHALHATALDTFLQKGH